MAMARGGGEWERSQRQKNKARGRRGWMEELTRGRGVVEGTIRGMGCQYSRSRSEERSRGQSSILGKDTGCLGAINDPSR
jgi:hypothetical protein